MIDFMVIGLPRSGTAWAANWLTTDTTLCLHDPLAKYHHTELDGLVSDKRLGVACTGLWMVPEWINAHPAKKVILHRPLEAINRSLKAMGAMQLGDVSLDHINGLHVDCEALWSDPEPIWNHLTGLPMDWERHALLSTLNVQIDFDRTPVDRAIVRRYLENFACLRS